MHRSFLIASTLRPYSGAFFCLILSSRTTDPILVLIVEIKDMMLVYERCEMDDWQVSERK